MGTLWPKLHKNSFAHHMWSQNKSQRNIVYQTHREIHRVLSNQRVLPRSSLFHSAGLREFKRRVPFPCASAELYITMCRNRTRCFPSSLFLSLLNSFLHLFAAHRFEQIYLENYMFIWQTQLDKQCIFKIYAKGKFATYVILHNDFKRKSTCLFATNLRDKKTI